MANTRRSNEPYKRHHWHSARTGRRNRFSEAIKTWKRVRSVDPDVFLEPEDKDLQLRRGANLRRSGHGRGGVSEGGDGKPHVDWLTVDKSRIRYQLEKGSIPAHRADELQRRLNL